MPIMSVPFTEEERQEALDFFRRFVADQTDAFGECENLPIRLSSLSITVNELEGECIDWCLQYLRKSQAPEAITALITHAAVRQIIEGDLSGYRQDESEDALLSTSKIAKDVMNKVLEVCKQWNEGTPSFYKSKMKYESCVHAIKNTRRKMEDKHVILPQFNNLFGFQEDHSNQAFFAVYDGHSGVDASNYAATHLHCHLARNKCLEKDPLLALKEAFEKTDKCFVAKAKREGLRSGSTGVAVLIKGETLYVAWLGDSQVVLSKAGQPTLLMSPHKPNREDERQRIEALGGCVVYFGAWRVNGSLSVSRAIGDAEHKPYISGEPDVEEFNMEGDEDFLILACDGLWDVVKPDEAVELVVQYLADGGDRSTVAKLLVDRAKSGGSNDNISVVVVFLDVHKRCVESVTDTVSSIALTEVDQDLSSDDRAVNTSENGTKENSIFENKGNISPVPSPKRSPKLSKKTEDENTPVVHTSPQTAT